MRSFRGFRILSFRVLVSSKNFRLWPDFFAQAVVYASVGNVPPEFVPTSNDIHRIVLHHKPSTP